MEGEEEAAAAAAASSSPGWIRELEAALEEGDEGRCVRAIPEGRTLPDELRASFWQVCLSPRVARSPPPTFDEIYDLPEQRVVREDCQQFVERLGNDDEDKVSVVSSLESVVTTYCKRTLRRYDSGDGWLEVLAPLVALKLPTRELFDCFEAIVENYVPRQRDRSGQQFHLFRLLVLYHDPELCSYLDTKRITPEKYCEPWFRSLFAGVCNLKVVQCIWDIYFQQDDPFLVFFLALVILINAKEQLMSFANDASENIVGILSQAPATLDAEDVNDFCSLAKFYSTRTPHSFRHDYHDAIFGDKSDTVPPCSSTLCLSISIDELLVSGQADPSGIQNEEVRYFVVDCRPAEQYNSGHLRTAFHLDASLMLQEPDAFSTAVEALFTTQKHALAADSVAAGEHLCFVGSGREQEDQYLHMVVASVLQKHTQYVSVATAGYIGLHEALSDSLAFSLTDHSAQGCIVCSPETGSQTSDTVNVDEFIHKDSLLGRFRSVVKSKTAEFTEKLVEYVHNTQINQPEERHVSSTDKLGKRYRQSNMASVFTIDDDGEAKKEEQDLISIAAWLKNPDVVDYYKCSHITDEGYTYSSLLVVTETHLYILREQNRQEGLASVVARRPLSSIVRITSKRKHPELITFMYGVPDGDDSVVTHSDRLIIPQAGDAAKLVKQQIWKTLT